MSGTMHREKLYTDYLILNTIKPKNLILNTITIKRIEKT